MMLTPDLVADLYVDLYNAIKVNPETVGHGRDGFYFGLNGEHTLYDVSKELGLALVALGKSQSEEPTTFTKAEIDKYFNVCCPRKCSSLTLTGVNVSQGSNSLGSNSRGLANHSKAIGWKPKKTTKDLLASIRPEVEEILRTNYKTAPFR
jgi:hypothetical protein